TTAAVQLSTKTNLRLRPRPPIAPADPGCQLTRRLRIWHATSPREHHVSGGALRRSPRLSGAVAGHDPQDRGGHVPPSPAPRSASAGSGAACPEARWWGYLESNQGPHPYQGCALTD